MSENEKKFEQLSAYLDGELTAAEAKRVEEALRRDESLAEELAALRATRDLVRNLPRQGAPEDLADRVMAQAERLTLVGARGGEQAGRPMRWVRYVAAAAVVVVAVGMGLIIKSTMDATRQGRRHVVKKETPSTAPEVATRTEGEPHKREAREKFAAKDADAERRLAAKPAPGKEATGMPPAPGEAGEKAVAETEKLDAKKELPVEPTVVAKPAAPLVADKAAPSDESTALARKAAKPEIEAAKGKLAEADEDKQLAALLANARSYRIDAVDLPRNRAALKDEVETVLRNNGLEPLTFADDRQRATTQARHGGYFYAKADEKKVQIWTVVGRDQVPELLKQLSRTQMNQVAFAYKNVAAVAPAGVAAKAGAGVRGGEAQPAATAPGAGYGAKAAPAPSREAPEGQAQVARADRGAEAAEDLAAQQVEQAVRRRDQVGGMKAEEVEPPATRPVEAVASKVAEEAVVQRALPQITLRQWEFARQVMSQQRDQGLLGADVEPLVIELNFVPPEPAADITATMNEAALRVKQDAAESTAPNAPASEPPTAPANKAND